MRNLILLNKNRRGFTLVELSIVLVIVGILTYGATSMFAMTAEKARIDATNNTLDAIERAIRLHYKTNGRIPYAANGATPLTDAAFGLVNGTSILGVVPTRTLNLPDSYMFDGWGNRISYFVTAACANAFVWTTPTTGCAVATPLLTVQDNNTPNIRTATAAYVVVSYGKNGLGAFNRNGGANTAPTSAPEIENTTSNSAPYSNTTFRDDFIKDWTDVPVYFDDMVRWKIPAQISYED